MNSKDTYRLNEAKAQQRLTEFRAENDVTLEGEIAAAKVLLEDALQQKNIGVSLAILNVISNLVKSHRLEATRTGELLSRNAVRKLGKEIGDIVASELEDSVPDWELVVDRIMDRIAATITTANNEEIAKR